MGPETQCTVNQGPLSPNDLTHDRKRQLLRGKERKRGSDRWKERERERESEGGIDRGKERGSKGAIEGERKTASRLDWPCI